MNKYGIITEKMLEPYNNYYAGYGYDKLRSEVTGVMEAKSVDVTGDGKDELFCVWYDNGIHAAVYEYENGNTKIG